VIIYPCRSDLFGHLSPQLEDSLGVFPWGFQDIRIAIAPSKIGMTEDGDKGESSNQERGNLGLWDWDRRTADPSATLPRISC
jgi:hypothetical protein